MPAAYTPPASSSGSGGVAPSTAGTGAAAGWVPALDGLGGYVWQPQPQIVAGDGVQVAAGGTATLPTISIASPTSLGNMLANGELTMDIDAAGSSSSDAGQSPATQQVLLSFFRARASWSAMKYLTFMLSGTAPASLTAVYGGLYSYNGVDTLARMDQTAESHAAFTGTYTSKKLALAGGAQNIVAGSLYAIALLQVGTTPGSLYGANGYTSWSLGQSGKVWRTAILATQSTLPTSIATSALVSGAGPWRMLASVTTS